MRISAFTDILSRPFEEALDALAGLGLEYVDLRSRIGADTVDTLTGAAAERVARDLRTRGLRCGCIASWSVNSYKGDYETHDPAHRKLMKQRVEHLARLAEQLGAPGVRVFSFKRPATGATEADRADNAAFLDELAGLCAERGRMLLIENEPPTMNGTCAELADLARRSKAPNLRLNWDVVNGWRGAEIPWAPGVFEAIAGRVSHMHIKGARANPDGSFGSMALPGADDVPHLEIFRKLARAGFAGIVTIDPHYHEFREADKLADAADPALEVTRRTIAYMRACEARLALEALNQAAPPKLVPFSPANAPGENYPWGAIHWLTGAKTNGARELTVGVTDVAKGGRNPLHLHPNCEEVLYVLAGEVEHFIEGTPRVRMQAGEAILVPRNLKHQAVNVGPGPARLLVSFSSADRQTVLIEE